jgi:hypothetical protein
VEANFINPLIKFDKPVFNLDLIWAEVSEPNKIGIGMAVTSKSTLDTEFRLNTKAPFSLDKDHFSLGPKEDTKFVV